MPHRPGVAKRPDSLREGLALLMQAFGGRR